MPKKDLNQLAKFIVDQATGEIPPKDKTRSAAAILGKLGGKARAQKLTKEQRLESSKKANAARWPKKQDAEAEQKDPKHLSPRGVIRPTED